jgi:hypothetical protein
MLINEYYYLKTNTYNTSNLYFKVRGFPKGLYREVEKPPVCPYPLSSTQTRSSTNQRSTIANRKKT